MSRNDGIILIVAVACGMMMPVVVITRAAWERLARHRRPKYEPAPRTVVTLPSLGEFSSYDNRCWFALVRDVEVEIENSGPPSEMQVEHVISLFDRLPQLADGAREFAKTQKEPHGLPGGTERFEIHGLSLMSDDTFELHMLHPADDDGFYRILFRDDEPIRLDRDD